MPVGITTLNALNWGTSTGGAAGASESTLTLGIDRLDVRTPPDQYHLWHAQISACKNLLLAMSADFKGGTRLLTRTQSANPFGAGESGFYIDTSGAAYKVFNGTPVALGAGGGSTGNWTFSGNAADLSAAGAMQLGSANATSVKLIPATLNFPSAMSMAATAQGATNTIGLSLAPNVADGASSVALDVNTGTTLTSGGAFAFRLRNNGSKLLGVQPYSGGGTYITGDTANPHIRLSDATGTFIGYSGVELQAISNSILITDGVGTFAINAGHAVATVFELNPDADGTRDLGLVGTRWRTVAGKRVMHGSQTMSFSATPAFDPTAGNFIDIGTVTGNITGATMVSGSAGERCTITLRKDATAGTYTIAFSGSNVRVAGNTLQFASGASSLVTLNFIWDDRLPTPAWVLMSNMSVL